MNFEDAKINPVENEYGVEEYSGSDDGS
jgi:hypothetical protein